MKLEYYNPYSDIDGEEDSPTERIDLETGLLSNKLGNIGYIDCYSREVEKADKLPMVLVILTKGRWFSWWIPKDIYLQYVNFAGNILHKHILGDHTDE